MPRTSIPAFKKDAAAVEITALAAGAGPPAKRMATRLILGFFLTTVCLKDEVIWTSSFTSLGWAELKNRDSARRRSYSLRGGPLLSWRNVRGPCRTKFLAP